MRDRDNHKVFLAALGGDGVSLVWQEQIHGDAIHIVTEDDRRKVIQGVDGLVFCHPRSTSPIEAEMRSWGRGSREKNLDSRLRGNDNEGSGNDRNNSLLLSVHTADCVPLLFFDPVGEVIAAAHAGWRGTVLHIGKKVVQTMQSFGSKITNIRVAIGPRVCGSCYTISGDREQKFREEFPLHPDILTVTQTVHTVDIGLANFYDLKDMGIPKSFIDFDPSLCTFEKTDEFYSYRRSGKPLEGEIFGVLDLRQLPHRRLQY